MRKIQFCTHSFSCVPGRGSVPALVYVTHELAAADQHVAGVTQVADDALELQGTVDEHQPAVHDVRRHAALEV